MLNNANRDMKYSWTSTKIFERQIREIGFINFYSILYYTKHY